MGRYHRPVAAWPGDVALGPHHLGRVSEKAQSKSTWCSAKPLPFDAAADRKQTARRVEAQIRSAVNAAALRGTLPD
jgi:hypothetical protein